MSERKRQAPLSEKEKEGKKRKEEEEDDNDEASEEDMQIEVPDATNAIRSQKNAVEPVVTKNTNTITTTATNFQLMTQEEEDLTIKVRNTGDALYDLVSLQSKKPRSYLRKK